MTLDLYRERITFDPKILVGKAIIKGTRISVEFILDLLARGWSYEEILENYPHLTKNDLLACIDYARMVIKDENVIPIQA